MIIINDTLGAYGGGQTLMLRMSTWLRSQDYDVTILCNNADNTEIVSALSKIGVRIVIVNIMDFEKIALLLKDFQKNHEIKVINFAWNQYLSIEIAKKQGRLQFDNFIYCIHPQTFMKGNVIGLPLLHEHIVREYGEILKRVNENNALLMMDEFTQKETENYFGYTLKINQPVIRIPINIEELPDRDQVIMDGYKKNIIFTSARAEFPFKGYLIGLVELFPKIKNEFPDARMIIISGGDDFEQLEEKISSLPENIKISVELHNWMKYDQLIELMKSAKVVIGMGTTVLDAARVYKPAILTETYKMECTSEGFFADAPEKLNAFNGDSQVFIKLLREIFTSSLEQYSVRAKHSFDMAKEYYEIGNVMKKLISLETKNKECILKNGEILEHKLGDLYRKIRYRGKRDFDYTKIRKEN